MEIKKDWALTNPKTGWIESATIRYIPEMDRFILNIKKGIRISRFGDMEAFKSVRSAKIFFTKHYYKGIWEVKEEI